MNRKSTENLSFWVDDGDNRQQRSTTLLRDVAYVIEAHFELTDKAGVDDSSGKHLDIFNRRARKGQFFHQPCFGNREFPANFELIESESDFPLSTLDDKSKDLGWMLYDIDFLNQATPRFFRAQLTDGVILVPDLYNSGVVK
jgi:CRISPR-associated protein Cas5d